jgi:hypothetical protein
MYFYISVCIDAMLMAVIKSFHATTCVKYGCMLLIENANNLVLKCNWITWYLIFL